MEKMYLSWQQIVEITECLAKKIITSGYSPDCLVGISLGGLIPLALLAEKLDTRAVYTIAAESYEGTAQKELQIRYVPNIWLSNKKVLLVDEIAETGNTLHGVRNALVQFCAAGNIKTATLAANTATCTRTPDFFVLEASCWVVFPWENDSEQ